MARAYFGTAACVTSLREMQRSTGTILVAVAAALWGLDAWIRLPLARSTEVATIVFGICYVLYVKGLVTLADLAGALGF